MEPIYIPQLLRAPEKTQTVEIKDFLGDLQTLTPVRGTVQITHGGNYLEVTAKAETIVTLKCDRCLKQYNHRLCVDTTELIWLEEEEEDFPVSEVEVKFEDLWENLHPGGYFQADSWLYEQLCLQLPMRQLCDQNCEDLHLSIANPPQVDSRWAGLEALKKSLE